MIFQNHRRVPVSVFRVQNRRCRASGRELLEGFSELISKFINKVKSSQFNITTL
jgi:hypothetical protein